MTERDLVRTGEAARLLNVAASTLRAAANKGHLTPAGYTPGGHYLWDVDDLRGQIHRNQEQRGRNLSARSKPDTP